MSPSAAVSLCRNVFTGGTAALTTPSRLGGPIPSLDDLLHLDPDRFVDEYTDIAAVNLACARGLNNADESRFPDYLSQLDTIAEAVERETERSRRLFEIKPAQFHHSEAVFKMYTMEYVFRRRFNIRYDDKVQETIEKGRRWDTDDSSEIFIHGILSDKRTGTCSSLPAFAIAVGRRLGYPLKLVLVPHHTLYRWDDGDEVFNLQHTEAGGDIREDEYFHKWPVEWTRDDYALNERTKVWLHSMNPRQETSKFLCNRAIRLREEGRPDEALQAIDAARRFNPNNPACFYIREDIQWRKRKPNDQVPLPPEAILPFPESPNLQSLLEMAARWTHPHGPHSQCHHPAANDPYYYVPDEYRPDRPPVTHPFPHGPQPHGSHSPFPGPTDPRLLIELAKLLAQQPKAQASRQQTSQPSQTITQTSGDTIRITIQNPRPQ